MIKKCAECGKEFETRNPQALYCNDQHYRPCPICGTPVAVAKHRLNESPKCCSGKCRHELLKRNMHKKACIFCGKEFTPTSGVNLVCEDTHYAKCEICGKEFIRTMNNYHEGITTCSRECTLKKMKKNYIGKYGVEHPMQSAEVQERHKAAMKEKYGVEHALQSADLKAKAVQTNQERFNADWALGSEIIHNRVEKTMLDKYGKTSYLATDECKEKSQATCFEKYGVENPMQSEEIRQKAKQTMLERYGVANVAQNLAVQEQIQAKRKLQMPEIMKKIEQTCLERYGVPYYLALPECGTKGTTVSKTNMQFGQKLKDRNMDYTIEKLLGTRPFDFELVGRNILIEIDPSYTHSTVGNHWTPKGLDIDYHKTKSNIAAQHGYRCIHIFDWDDQDKILNMLQPTVSVYARNLSLGLVDPVAANKFLTQYHLQGTCRGQMLYVGLFAEDTLYQLMTFGRPRYDKSYDSELLRLCTRPGFTVVGGASRLLKYAQQQQALGKIISYCDAAKFTGDVYEAIGMKLIRETPPQEVWSRGRYKVTANLLRQRGFDQLFNTNFGKGTSNEELMLQHNWLPVYDCGQKVFAL